MDCYFDFVPKLGFCHLHYAARLQVPAPGRHLGEPIPCSSEVMDLLSARGLERQRKRTEVRIIYFQPDEKNTGGAFVITADSIKKVAD
jgi:hypothetical protein